MGRLDAGVGHLHHDGALHPLAEQIAAVGIHPPDAAGGVVGVGGTAAGAVEPGPAVPAVRPGVGVAELELVPEGRVGHALPHVAHGVLRVPHELVAGVQLAPGGHRQVLRAAAAAGDPLVHAGTALQVDHIVVEGDGPALPPPADHLHRQALVLLVELGLILLRQGVGLTGGADHRLHGQLRKAQVRHVEDVLGEIHVVVGEGAPDVVALSAPGLHQLLELGHDDVVAALVPGGPPQPVVDLLPAIQAQHHVVHLPVGEVDDVVVDEHAVGGEGEAEALVVDLLLLPAVGHQALDHVPVHQRLSAEEVHLQVPAAAGIGDEKVQGLLAHLVAHQGPLPLVLALAGEAVLAGEVAGVGHVEAQGLDHGVLVLEIKGQILVLVRGEELPPGLQVLHALQHGADLLRRYLRAVPVLCQHPGDDLLSGAGLVEVDDVVGQVVHRVDGAAVHIQYDIISVELIAVNHSYVLPIPFVLPPGRPSFSLQKAPPGCLQAGRRRFPYKPFTPSRRSSRTAGWPRRRKSCRRTGKRSGTRRSRRW